MPPLNKQQILLAEDRQVIEEPVPEWGGSVRIRSLSARGREVVEGLGDSASAAEGVIRARVLAMSLVDQNNALLFDEADLEALAEKGHGPVSRLFDRVLEFNGLSKKSIERMEKNSGTGPNASSPSASPANSA